MEDTTSQKVDSDLESTQAALDATRFQLLEKIGSGGMGVVYRATDKQFGRTVAIKILHPIEAKDSKRAERLRREALMLEKLRHPNLVHVLTFDIGPDSRPYIVMEYLEGTTLEKEIAARGHLTVDETLSLARQLADAMVTVHTAGVVHRDLTPANVMLLSGAKQQPRIKILDFGIAKGEYLPTISQGLTQPNYMVGNLPYMSPEQISGAPADVRMDIYSFGCLLYHALSGMVPFVGENSMELAFRHSAESAAPIDRLIHGTPRDRAVHQLMMRCMEKKIEDRFESFSDVLAALEAVEEGRFQQFDIARQTSRTPLKPILFGLVALMVTGFLLVSLWSRNKSDESLGAEINDIVGTGRRLQAGNSLDSSTKAQIEFQKAIDLFESDERNLKSKSLLSTVGKELSLAYTRVGEALTENSKCKKAELYWQRSIDIRKQVPSSATRLELSQAYAGLGQTLVIDGQYKAAIPALERSIDMLGTDDPGRLWQLTGLQSLALCYAVENTFTDKQKPYLLLAVDRAQTLLSTSPGDAFGAGVLADGTSGLAKVAANAKNEQESLRLFLKAARVRQGLVLGGERNQIPVLESNLKELALMLPSYQQHGGKDVAKTLSEMREILKSLGLPTRIVDRCKVALRDTAKARRFK